jgi:hypothetical protein
MAGLFGVKTYRSEDSASRAFADANDAAVTAWIDQQMDRTFARLLEQEWALDLDATVKTLYGHPAVTTRKKRTSATTVRLNGAVHPKLCPAGIAAASRVPEASQEWLEGGVL